MNLGRLKEPYRISPKLIAQLHEHTASLPENWQVHPESLTTLLEMYHDNAEFLTLYAYIQ